MPTSLPKAKSTSKLKKPHQLLEESLALFGPKGEFWIQGSEVDYLEEGFFPRAVIHEANACALERSEVADEITDLLSDGTSAVEAIKIIDKKYVYRDEVQTFCSIGALHHINTDNETLAIEYLATAINPKKVKRQKADYVADQDEGYTYNTGDVDFDDIITKANDETSTTFAKVRGWFKKAITIAKKAGD